MFQKMRISCNSPRKQNNVIIVIVLIVLTNIQVINCKNELARTNIGLSDNINSNNSTILTVTTGVTHIQEQCIQRCPQNRTNSDHVEEEPASEDECKTDCFIKQCQKGCQLWEAALDSSCQIVCNKTDKEEMELNDLYCVMGCNDAINRYFKWLKIEIGTPSAPALVADSLTATSLSLEWSVPLRFYKQAKGAIKKNNSTLVQWRYEEGGDWKFCKNQSIGDNSTIKVESLMPYTKYRFRVALVLSENYDEVLISDQSVIISTLASGIPLSEPQIIRAIAVDQTRITISWGPGQFPNGPILSYVLQIRELLPVGYLAIKEVPASDGTNFYMFEKLGPAHNYTIMAAMRNSEGTGPSAEKVVSTLPYLVPKDDEPQPEPKLILAAEFSVLSQGSDLLSEPPKTFYKSASRIMGMAIHISKKLMFVSDETGFIYQAPLEVEGEHKPILRNEKSVNFKPMLLSIDWLNDHLYILGEMLVGHNAPNKWQISRCNLNGSELTVAIGGLNKKPNHIEVDPFNGFLFWVITGTTSDDGLFRLDLGDISNGIKHEDKPLQMIKGHNLGAFTVDHTRFRLLVPFQDDNTVMSVSLDGKEQEDIRKNTQSPKFHLVKSLAIANGLFYWTNVKEVLTEEYHKFHNSYYHNAYPDLSDTSFITVFVNLPHAQPTPIPVNPPSNVQALLSSDRAKVSWRIPHLLGNQGKGAWQNWNYELEIFDVYKNVSRLGGIVGNTFTVNQLLPNTLYTFRVAAYTKVGQGPWAQEFKAKTLKSSHNRSLIWSSNDGLLSSDVIGEDIKTLISKSELGETFVTDIAWFEDMLYIISNSTLKFYNRTNLQKFQKLELDSVEGVAVDWIGRKLYWSNPTQQLITRGKLNGEQHETLPIIAAAKEIKIDALRGNIYFSTGLIIDTCRLNGKNRKNYFGVRAYSGKQVMGLTLDLDSQKIFWIVRSYSVSSLYYAPLADSWIDKPIITEIPLEEKSLNGPLTHFSDRLVWLQDDKTVVVGDLYGKNLAYLENKRLIGLKAVSVIDPTHYIYPTANETEIDGPINVIPEAVKNYTIRIIGSWKIFNITWEPIENVNYGNVYYDIKVKHNKVEFNSEQTESTYQIPPHSLPPYSSLDITVRAFTFWGASAFTKRVLFSPAAPPIAPSNPRVFINFKEDPINIDFRENVVATFRWDEPLEPNGKILGYKVRITYMDDRTERILDNSTVSGQEKKIEHLMRNMSYTFQVLAYSVGDGSWTEPLHISTLYEKPLPIVLVANQTAILEADLDLKIHRDMVNTRNPIVAMAHISREDRIYWFNENNELICYKNHEKSKLLTTTSEVVAMTIDWIERIIYWAQVENNMGVIYSYNLNRGENIDEQIHNRYAQKVLDRQSLITDLVVSPFDRKLFWIENFKNLSDENTIYFYHLDTYDLRVFFEYSDECLNKTMIPIDGTLMLATSAINPSLENVGDGKNYQSLVIFDDTQEHFVAADIRTKDCFTFGANVYYSAKTNLAKDSIRLYWINEEVVYGRNDLEENSVSMPVPGATKLLTYYQQRYPKRHCLYPEQNFLYQMELLETTDDSIKIELPMVHLPNDCFLTVIPIKYVIEYSELEKHKRDSDKSCAEDPDCHIVHSFDRIKIIEHLKPFTKYIVRFGLTSIYGSELDIKVNIGNGRIFVTKPGAPSQPRNVSVLSLSFTDILVSWLPPTIFNSDSIHYEIHWQTENIIDGLKNKQQQLVSDFGSIEKKNSNNYHDDLITITLKNLLPKQSYTIWIRAYSSNTTFSESESVNIETYPEPDNLVLNHTTPYTMILKWNPQPNISHYVIQYTAIDTSEWITIFDSKMNETTKNDYDNNSYYHVDKLQPKTKYHFSIQLFYINVPNRAYRWPALPIEDINLFETLGDCPSPPGRPLVRHISENVYQVVWESSKENGAVIEEYILETLKRITVTPNTTTHRSERSSSSDNMDHNEVHLDLPQAESETPTEIMEVEIAEEWIQQYSGTDSYWIIKNNLHPINEYVFRVRARNQYGYSSYSETSKLLDPTFPKKDGLDQKKDDSNIAIFIIALPASLISLACLFMCVLLVIYRKRQNKKYSDDIMPIPDFELATLRDLQAGDNFIQSNRNILYNHFYGSQITDTEISLLPHIGREQISLTEFLGAGAFGEVHGGILIRLDEDEAELRVAVKTLRKGATEQEKWEFLKEAQLMSNFKHDHILKLIGICLENSDSALYIVMELMEGGDLLSYLRSNRPSVDRASDLSLLDLITMCVDVTSGCRYLEEMHFVHRDLAARNCLVSSCINGGKSGRIVKIGDFGLARDIYKNDYYRKEGEGLLPVRWMSPESLVDGVFTSQSDIWSFGVLTWEIMTMGQQPYPARTNIEVLHYVRGGGRLERPIDCPEELHQLMLKCWNYSADQRPTFRYCLDVLQLLQDQTSQYTKITTQFTADQFKNWSSGSGQILSSAMQNIVNQPIVVTPLSSASSQVPISIPKYLELMYDESLDSNNNEGDEEQPKPPIIVRNNSRASAISVNSKRSSVGVKSLVQGDGYEIPIANDILELKMMSLVDKHRTLSNSSTVSNSSSLPHKDESNNSKQIIIKC